MSVAFRNAQFSMNPPINPPIPPVNISPLLSALTKMGADLKFALTLAEVAIHIAQQRRDGPTTEFKVTVDRLEALLELLKNRYRRKDR